MTTMTTRYSSSARTMAPPAVAAESALPARTSAGTVMAGVLALLVGIWGAGVPYAGPAFGFGATGTPSWTWNDTHLVLGLGPGLLAILAAFVMLGGAGRVVVGMGRGAVAMAGMAAVIAGAWFAIGPTTIAVWHLTSSPYLVAASPTRSMLDSIGYTLGPGIVLAACGGMALGQAVRRRVPAVDPAGFPLAPQQFSPLPPAAGGPGAVTPLVGATAPEATGGTPAVTPPTAAVPSTPAPPVQTVPGAPAAPSTMAPPPPPPVTEAGAPGTTTGVPVSGSGAAVAEPAPPVSGEEPGGTAPPVG